jgi:hypothetical protein
VPQVGQATVRICAMASQRLQSISRKEYAMIDRS